jgi:hypothetical protein
MNGTQFTLQFDGQDDYIEVPDDGNLSVTDAGLSVSAWIRPDVLTFPKSQGTGYIHWLGKGQAGAQEWTFRMYNAVTTDHPPRPNRISFYVFNPAGAEGVGSYFQDPTTPGTWIHVVGVVDSALTRTAIYKNGQFRRCDRYQQSGDSGCEYHNLEIQPQPGGAPMRIGTRDFESFFQGAIKEVRVWNRPLADAEVMALYSGTVSADGLVAEYLLSIDTAVDTVSGNNGTIYGATWRTE